MRAEEGVVCWMGDKVMGEGDVSVLSGGHRHIWRVGWRLERLA